MLMVYTFSHVCYNIRAFHIILFGAHRVTLDGCAMSFFILFLAFRLDYTLSYYISNVNT
nr:MAG TPA: hypothetical protein [Bacteriophage sp.]